MNTRHTFTLARVALAGLTIFCTLTGGPASAQSNSKPYPTPGIGSAPMPGMRSALPMGVWSKVRWELPLVLETPVGRMEIDNKSFLLSCWKGDEVRRRTLDSEERKLLARVIYEAALSRGSSIRVGDVSLFSTSLVTALRLLRIRTLDPESKSRSKWKEGKPRSKTAPAAGEATKTPYQTPVSIYGTLKFEWKEKVMTFFLTHETGRSQLFVATGPLKKALHRLKDRRVRVVGYRKDGSNDASIFVTGIPIHSSKSSSTWVSHAGQSSEGPDLAVLRYSHVKESNVDYRIFAMRDYLAPAEEPWPTSPPAAPAAPTTARSSRKGLSGALGGQ